MRPTIAWSAVISGSEPSGWRTGLHGFARVRWREVAPGVDLVLHASRGRLEYDLEVAPGGAVEHLVLRCEGAGGLELRSDGSLEVLTPVGPLSQTAPVAWERLRDEQVFDSETALVEQIARDVEATRAARRPPADR